MSHVEELQAEVLTKNQLLTRKDREMTRLREQLRECQERIPGGPTRVRSLIQGVDSDG